MGPNWGSNIKTKSQNILCLSLVMWLHIRLGFWFVTMMDSELFFVINSTHKENDKRLFNVSLARITASCWFFIEGYIKGQFTKLSATIPWQKSIVSALTENVITNIIARFIIGWQESRDKRSCCSCLIFQQLQLLVIWRQKENDVFFIFL